MSNFKLRKYQQAPAKHLLKILRNKNSAVDGSEMGTGKTYVAAWVAKQLGIPVLVVCPKVVITPWKAVLRSSGAEVLDVINYEKLTRGAYGAVSVDPQTKSVRWNIGDCLIVFDEAQRCKAWYDDATECSLNAKLLIAAADAKNVKILLASGTLASDPTQMYAIGYALGLHKIHDFKHWIRAHGCSESLFGWTYKMSSNMMSNIHHALYPSKGTRLRKSDLGDEFPERVVDVIGLETDPKATELFTELDRELLELETKKQGDHKNNVNVAILRARQESELLKVPHLIELILTSLKNEEHVAVFTNFEPTLRLLSDNLGVTCIVDGSTTGALRDKNISKFQNNEEPVILVNLQAGGVGLSLHDIHGGFPRRSFICPTFRSDDLAQAVDRTHRNGAKSPAHSTIVFWDSGVERKVCAKVQKRLDNLAALNDDALRAPYDLIKTRASRLAEAEKPFAVNEKLLKHFGLQRKN